MRTGLERYLSFSLAGAEMQMVEVVRNRLIERRKLGIKKKMMVARVLAIRTGRGNTHVAQPEGELELGRDGCPILKIDEIDLSALTRPRGTSGLLRPDCDHAADQEQQRGQECADPGECNIFKRLHG